MTNVEERDENISEEALSDDNPTEDDSRTNGEEGTFAPEGETGGDVSSDDGDEDGGNSEDDSHQARKDRAKAQIERLKEENKRLKEEKRKADRNQEGRINTEVYEKAYLAATHDIKESEAQEEALRLSDKFDMTVDELMEDSDYRDRIKSFQKKVINRKRVASNSGGAAQRKKDATYVAEYFKKNQAFPEGTSLEMRSKAIDIVTGKQEQNWQR